MSFPWVPTMWCSLLTLNGFPRCNRCRCTKKRPRFLAGRYAVSEAGNLGNSAAGHGRHTLPSSDTAPSLRLAMFRLQQATGPIDQVSQLALEPEHSALPFADFA
jgi:hypothetical protein